MSGIARLFEYFHRTAQSVLSKPTNEMSAHGTRIIGALLDAGTSTLLTVTSRPSVLLALNELVPGSVYLRTVRYGRNRETRALLRRNASEYPEWRWSQEKALFLPSHVPPSEELRGRAALATAKRDALYLLIERVNGLRLRPEIALQGQTLVYLEKRDQALEFKKRGYDEAVIGEYPYVEQYATIAKRSPRQATDEILFQARLFDDVVTRSEAVRLRFLGMIRDARAADDLAHFEEELDELTLQVLK